MKIDLKKNFGHKVGQKLVFLFECHYGTILRLIIRKRNTQVLETEDIVVLLVEFQSFGFIG